MKPDEHQGPNNVGQTKAYVIDFNKIDGSNVCFYHYLDANGRQISHKTKNEKVSLSEFVAYCETHIKTIKNK